MSSASSARVTPAGRGGLEGGSTSGALPGSAARLGGCELCVGSCDIRFRLGVAGRLNRNNAIRGGRRHLIGGLGGELAGGLGFGLVLLLGDLELLLLSGKGGTLVRLELVDLFAKCGDLRGGSGGLVCDGRRGRGF